MSKLANNSRDYGIDLTKVVAIFSVLLIHSCSMFGAYSAPLSSFDWYSGVFWGGVCRAGVPLFFMCSGALMLDPGRDYSIKKLWTKNILRILIAALVWGFIYKLYHLIAGGAISAATLFSALEEVLLFKTDFHFYFLQIILLVYAFLPLTRAFVKAADKRLLQYAIFIWAALGIVYPTVAGFWPFKLLSGIPKQWLMNMSYAAIGYGLLGFYLKTYPLKKSADIWLALGGLAFVLGGTVFMSLRRGALYSGFMEGMTLGVCLMAAGIFGLCGKAAPRSRRLVSIISKASFCIYLSHILFLYIFQKWGLTGNFLPTALTMPLIALALFLPSFALYVILSKIPLVRRWLI